MAVKIICPMCQFSKDIPEEMIPPGVRWVTCPRCRHRFQFGQAVFMPEAHLRSAQKDDEKEIGRIPSPWERRAELGNWAGISLTLKSALLSPSEFFKTTAIEGGIKEPLAFGLLTGSAGMMFEVFWQFLFMSEDIASLAGTLFGVYGTLSVFLGVMAFCPLFVLLAILITSLIVHGLLVVVRGGGSGFEATLRVISFSQATQLCGLIPLIGSFVGALWFLAVQIIGLKEIHRTSYRRVAMALILPLVMVLVLLGIVVVGI